MGGKKLLLLNVKAAHKTWYQGWNIQMYRRINKMYTPIGFRRKMSGHGYFHLDLIGQRVPPAQQNTALALSGFENNFQCIQIVPAHWSCFLLGFYTLLLLLCEYGICIAGFSLLWGRTARATHEVLWMLTWMEVHHVRYRAWRYWSFAGSMLAAGKGISCCSTGKGCTKQAELNALSTTLMIQKKVKPVEIALALIKPFWYMKGIFCLKKNLLKKACQWYE